MLDDVVRYVLDEVAMDGSIGTSPSRFIALFSRPTCPLNLANSSSSTTSSDPSASRPAEHVTQEQEQEREHYAAYVWRMVVDLEAMSVGLIGKSVVEEEQGDPDAEATGMILDPALMNGSAAVAKTGGSLEADKHDLMVLKEKYGDKVVIRANEAEVMNALTGSYVRPSRLSQIVYSALQFIARGKEFGMSVLDIAKKTGQKPSTVFYLVKTLTDMGIVAKIKDTESNKTNIAVHRRYLDENFQYQLRMEHMHYHAEVNNQDVKPDLGQLEAEDNIPIDPSTGLPQFPPFGLESLGSRAFIKYRLVKLLRSDLWHHLIENRLLLKFMGFQPAYTLQTRRQFQRHVQAFKREGLIDEVLVPDENIPDRPHRCLRLAEFRPRENEQEHFEGTMPNMVASAIDPALIDLEELEDEDLLEEEAFDEPASAKDLAYDYSYTIDHAVLQTVKRSGTQGLTIRQIMRSLNHLDHKTVDVIVARYERLEHHPSHLNDFLFKVTQEVHRREKRLRVFTLENFRQRCLEDGIQLDDEIATHPNIGRYADLSEYRFTRTQAEAKAALDREWIAVPRVCDKVLKEHKKFTRPPPGQPRIPKTHKKAMAAGAGGDLEHAEPQVLGRPRKFIKTIGLDGKLVKRTKNNVIPVHPELPATLLYNSKTKVFFPVPEEWDGVGPVRKPVDWDTAEEPTCPIIPSTGLPALPGLQKQVKRKKATAAAKENKKNTKKHDREDDSGDTAAPPKKKGRPRKTDEAATAKKAETAPTPADASEPEAELEQQDVEIVEIVTEPAKDKGKKNAKPVAAAPVEIRPATKRRGAAKKKVIIEEPVVLSDTEDARDAGTNDATEAPATLDSDCLPGATGMTQQPGTAAAAPTDAMDVDDPIEPVQPTSDNAPLDINPPPLDLNNAPSLGHAPVDSSASPRKPDASTGFALDPSLSTPTGQAAAAAPTLDADADAGLPARKRLRKSVASSPPDLVSVLEPESKRAKHSKLHRPRGSLQNPYRKREILEFIHSEGGVTLGGGFLAANMWEWIRANNKTETSQFKNAPDKVTIDRLLDSLEAEKELVKIKVDLNMHWGGNNSFPVVTLPNTSKTLIRDFINEAKQSRQRATPLPPKSRQPGFTRTGGELKVSNRKPIRLTGEATVPLLTPVSTLESLPADEVREMFHQDWRLLAQSYGYIAGSWRRAKCLHLELLRVMETHGETLRNGDRVMQIDFLRRETSLQNICKILPITVTDDALYETLKDPEESSKPLRECTVAVQSLIGVRRKTMRFKLARLLIALALLGILESGNLMVDENRRPVSFQPASPYTSSYIRVASKVPVYNYSGEVTSPTTPPLKLFKVSSAQDVEELWYAIWFLSLTKGDVNVAAVKRFKDSASVEGLAPAAISTTLRRKLSTRANWQSEYSLQKAQRRYLEYVYQTEPGAAESDPKRHEELAYRIFAPVGTVHEYLAHLATRHGEKSTDVRIHQPSTRVPTAAVREAIAEKVRQRNEKLESEWAQQVLQCLAEVNQQATQDLMTFLEPLHKQYLRNPRKHGPQHTMNAITSYLARLENTSGGTVVRRPRGNFAPHRPVPDYVPRRSRTKWTPQMDEMARDAFIILQARKESLGLQNTGHYEALGQLFTAVDSFKVRSRILKWRRSHPANDAYLQRMKSAWQQVCVEHASEIPDPHPESFENFDLLAHIALFRKYVKRDQRVSSFYVDFEKKAEVPALPDSVEALLEAFTIEDKHKPMRVLDDVWSYHGDEKRDKALMAVSTVHPRLAEEPSASTESASKEAGLIESVIKLIVANPLDTFDEAKADRLLTPLNRTAVESHVKSMLQAGILTAYDKSNPNRAPGRAYLFQDSYYRTLNLPISQELQQDAEELLPTVPEDEFVPWPIIAKEGEFASLLSLISEDMVDMQIEPDGALDILDTKGFRRARIIDDDCIEVGVNLKLNERGMGAVDGGGRVGRSLVWPAGTSVKLAEGEAEGKGKAKGKGKAREKVVLASALISAVENAGKDGLSVKELKDYFNESDSVIILALERALDHGKLFLSGYARPVVVHPKYRAEWQLSEDLPQPKQWIDIEGRVVGVALQRCRRAVYGLLVQKPGINEHDLRAALSVTFNRQETNDLLQQLLDEGRISRVVSDGVVVSGRYVDLFDGAYEPLISWFPGTLW